MRVKRNYADATEAELLMDTDTPAPIVVLIVFVAVGMMSNTWVLIIAGRQAKRPDIK